MLRLTFFVIAVGAATVILSWFADKPGSLTLEWLGYRIETSVFAAGLFLGVIIVTVVALWSALRYLLTRPAVLSELMKKKREKRGLDALSRGLIAVGAGSRDEARKCAGQAYKLLPGEPLTGLLRAQSAQLHGDRAAARLIFETMAEAPETEMLGLRGLFLEARREDESEAARQFAERAMERNPDLAWSVNALFELQCKAGDWAGALRTLDVAQRQKQIEKPVAARRRAVLLTAQAMEAEARDTNSARQLALEAHKLAPGLVPAAEIAGRAMASGGDPARAAKVIAKTWEINPHPDLAIAYAHLRSGESPRERLKRVKFLSSRAPDHVEGAIAVASAAVEARAWDEAREALEPYIGVGASARVCALMARIEGGDAGDQGRVREWLARAVHAPRDPAWTADGYISSQWAPISPITGALDAFEWKAPVELLGARDHLVIEEAEPRPIEGPAPAEPESGESDRPAIPETVASIPAPDGQLDDMESEIFVPPHAPDDPGPDGRDGDEDLSDERKFPAPTG